MDDPDVDERIEIDPRTPEEVAARLIVIETIARRGLIEQTARESGLTSGTLAGDAFDLRAFLLLGGLSDSLTPRERVILEAPPGTLHDDDLYECIWQTEALQTLWAAVGILPEQPPGRPAGDPQLTRIDDEDDSPSVRQLARLVVVPSDEECAKLREQYELWHWRGLVEEERRAASGNDLREIEEVIAGASREAASAGLIPTDRRGDFASGRKPIREWSSDDLAAFVIASEYRLRAINWLCGFGADWDNVPVFV
jgi:hypothetical protein